jgi:hypothetical protein
LKFKLIEKEKRVLTFPVKFFFAGLAVAVYTAWFCRLSQMELAG